MTDLISALVANGTTFAGWGYQSWLPFYNYGLIIPFLAFVIGFLVSARWAISFLVATSIPLILLAVIAEPLDMTPLVVLWVWGLMSALNLLSSKMKWNPLGLKIHEEHDLNWTRQEYFNHIKAEHPDIWKQYFEEEDEKKDDS